MEDKPDWPREAKGFRKRRDMPGGLWMRCRACTKMIYRSLVLERGNVCPECNYHFEITSAERIRLICDPDTFREEFTGLRPRDPLGFVAEGQSFQSSPLAKIPPILEAARAAGRELEVEVDGGIDLETLPIAREAGANVFVAGSAIFQSDQVPGTVMRFRELLDR